MYNKRRISCLILKKKRRSIEWKCDVCDLTLPETLVYCLCGNKRSSKIEDKTDIFCFPFNEKDEHAMERLEQLMKDKKDNMFFPCLLKILPRVLRKAVHNRACDQDVGSGGYMIGQFYFQWRNKTYFLAYISQKRYIRSGK